MKGFIFLCLLVSFSAVASNEAALDELFNPVKITDDFQDGYEDDLQPVASKDYAAAFERDMPGKTLLALNGLVRFSYLTLKAKRYGLTANLLKDQWHKEKKEEFRKFFYSDARKIGDFKPLSEWLAHWYDNLERLLGKPVCDLLHLSDIKTFNYAIPVVFDPCYPLWVKQDFIDHFATDGNYHGLAPVVLYWVSYGVCSGATWGMGLFIICGGIGTAVELVFEHTLAKPMASRIYDRMCDGTRTSRRKRTS